jgi:hypothetical protein
VLGLRPVDLLDRHVRHGGPGDAAIGEFVQRGDVVGEVRAAGAETVRPDVHELVHHQLVLVAEQLEKRYLAGRRGEGVVAERDHRQPASLRGESVLGARRLLLRDQQLFASLPPLVGGHRRWDCHAIDLVTEELATATGCVHGGSLN